MFRQAATITTATLVLCTTFDAELVHGQACGDLNSIGGVTTTDALLALKRSVGQEVDLDCPVPARTLRTGQTLCYEADGQVQSCTGTEQDGMFRYGVARSFTDNGDGTVSDNATGLMWEKHSDDGSIHDVHNLYTWPDAFEEKVAKLNSDNFAGYDDWRLPNRFELDTLVNLGASDPATYPQFHSGCAPACTVLTCSCTGQENHWSSTTDHAPPEYAWSVRFNTGYTDRNPKALASFAVRVVRSGI